MKINRITKSIVLFLLILLYACGGGGKMGEPNNEIDQANQAPLDEAFNMKIDEEGDIDWYKLELPAQGYLKVMARDIPEAIEPEAAFAIYEGWQDNNNDFMKTWTKLPCAAAIPEKGTYYVAIIDNYNDAASKDEFEVKFSFLEEFDDFEPNSEIKDAKNVSFDKIYKSAIFPTGEQDWFKVQVEEQGYLTVKAKNVDEDLTLETRYATYDEFNPEEINVIRNYGKLPHSAFIEKPGEYYFQILDNYNDAGSEQLFEWKIEFTPEMDPAEPNNDFRNAKEVNENDILELAIFPVKDVDIYKVNISKPGTLRFSAKDYDPLVPEIHLAMRDTTGKDELLEIGRWMKLPAEVEIPDTTNEYYVKFIDNYNDQELKKAFAVKVEMK